MKKTRKKKIATAIVLIVILILEIKAFTDSRANKITEITANIIDTSGLLKDETFTFQATNEKDIGTAITLPEIINEKKIKNYIVEKKQIENNKEIITSSNTQNNSNNSNNENISTNNTTKNENLKNTVVNNITKNESLNSISTNNTNQNEKNDSEDEQIILPGEKIYLTKQELKEKKIVLKVEYETKKKEEQILYNKTIEKEIDTNKVTISGFMPECAQIKVENSNLEQVKDLSKEHINDKTNIKIAYDIKIIVEEKEYEPTDFDENVEVTISGIDINSNEKYKVIHIDDKNKTDEIKDVEINDNTITFKANEFSTYALLSETTDEETTEDSVTENDVTAYAEDEQLISVASLDIDVEEVWDGSTIVTEFKYGTGTEQKPYLISDGAELAYLAQQVNAGTNYEGIYFQLASDIDLGNNEWTPIGTTDNSFRGVLDGAGHTIANVKITVSSLPDQTYNSYGLFGSIGGGDTRSIIRNLELTSIKIDITASGATGTIFGQDEEGIRIGCLAGSLYKNSNIENVIVSKSTISDTNTIQVYNYQFQFAVGGVVGYITNTSTTNTDPGSSSRYVINNCYSNVEIALDATASVNTGFFYRDGRGQYHTGGIVGTIRSQQVWPTNCLYDGTIQGNGYIGPIFGGLINNSSYSSISQTIWNGNDAGNLTTNNAYYTNYSAAGTTFTQSVTSGTSTARKSNSSNNVGYVQGVNKGSYTTNMTTMLNTFNGNVTTENKYVTWLYENNVFTFKERLTTYKTEPEMYTYKINIDDPYQVGNYTMTWYRNGEEDSSITGDTYVWTPNYEQDENIVVVTYDGSYYTVTKFTIKRIHVDIVFDIDTNNDSVTASLEGEGMIYTSVSDYTFQWYKYDISGEGGPIEGETSLTLNNLEEGMDYKLVATNNVIPKLSAENTFTYGDRIVIFVDYNNGNNNRDGYTPQTAVQTLPTAYSKLDSGGSINTNIIVIIGNYTTRDVFYNTKDSTNTNYQKSATITGKYAGIDYKGRLYMYYNQRTYNFINGNTHFQYLTFDGNGSQAYLYAQGHDLIMGKGLHMENYAAANTNQGLITGSAPAFHVLGGYLQYNRTKLPRNNGKIIIKSGAYGRVLGGGGSGDSSGAGQTTSKDFTGSNLTDDTYTETIYVNIEESTKGNYAYDINLLVGGATAGNMYANISINVENGSIGRLLGGSIGDASEISNWNYPENTFIGYTTINLTGGTIGELYGGSLGRNMDAIGIYGSSYICDIYHYGTININISGSTVVNSNIYGAGAGGVTGYSENSSDAYKSYGKDVPSVVNMNITGGTINGNIYGGGYGYTEYLTEDVTATDGGALYGDSNIIISDSPTINGNIYGAGCGYNYSNKTLVAQVEGNSNIEISGTPTINGQVFGAGQGISDRADMAKLTGSSTIKINTDLSIDVYGGGNISKVEGTTNVNVESGTQTGSIYGGGNLGIINGTTNVTINGGNLSNVYGGGNQAEVTKSNVIVNGGKTTAIYAGGNAANVSETSTKVNDGEVTTIFGGSNIQGDVTTSKIEVNDGKIENVYGGNNQGGTTTNTNVDINGGIVTKVFGGGNQAITTTSIVNINGGNAQDVFGGGDQAEVTTSNVNTTSGTVTNIYGGGNKAGVTTSNIITTGGNIGNVFGGSNQSGDVNESFITTNEPTDTTNSVIQNVYGGNNLGGSTTTTNVTINGGGVIDVFGGGNQATTNLTNVQINGAVEGSVYGGGNQAGVNTNTNVNLLGANVTKNVYGGGNEGTVTGNTNVHVKNSTLGNSLYAGGNGTTAVVYGNTNLTMDGTTNQVKNNVFGGGNQAATGEESSNNSKSTVNIVGGTIGKNVYGGANTSVVYGTTQTNIGYDAVNNSSLEIGNVEIEGTVFGGGEANASGSEIYDFSFISVTKGIDIQIDGNRHEKFAIKGSIFGSGNASSTSGESYITIKNYGTADNPQSNVSIQRANCATLSNSAITLSGATDRTNEYSTVFFSISRIDRVKLKNNSILYLCNGANLLKNLDSLVDVDGNEEKATVTIDSDTGENTKNVDNRIYMLEGKNLNIATNEQVTAYGQVTGMTFFGLFTNRNNPSTSTGFYHTGYNNGDTITNEGTFASNSYVMAQHMADHNTEVDGFYTNYKQDGKIKVNYIGTTPEDDVYYIWLVGEKMDVTVFEMSLTASKYATLGTYELLLQGFSDPNIKFVISGFSSGLANGISLVNPSEIETIEPDEEKANSTYGLSMKTGNSGWQNKGTTTFLTENGGSYLGQHQYDADNSKYTPTLNFCLYHSQNISKKQALGDVRIRFQVLKPIDDLNYDVSSYIDINITLSSALYQNDFYEAAITPGQQFELFTTTETTITNKSAFSTYYSLYIDKFSESDYYDDYKTYQRVIVSRDSNSLPYVLPENTKLTMLDMVTNQYYYYIVTAQDVADGKYIYNLSDFIAMGSNDKKFDEQSVCDTYYNQEQDLIYENFIFHINFADATIQNNISNNSLLMELRDTENQTLIGVLGIQRDTTVYSVYNDKDATIKLEASVEPETLYLGNTANLNVSTIFTQSIENTKTIYDTQFFDKKLGIKISIYDNNGNRLNSDSLLGVNFELDGKLYYPRIDGTTRINIADKVTNVLAKIKLNTKNNKTLATGDYKIKIESFGSSDGIYYGLVASDMVELDFRIINSAYGLKAKSIDSLKIINKDTGCTLDGGNSLQVHIEYSSALSNPNIAMSLYRRDYSETYSQNYTLVDLSDYVSDLLTSTGREKEYVVSNNPLSSFTKFLLLKPNLTTGTYKLVFKLYDGNVYVGEAYEYMVIK